MNKNAIIVFGANHHNTLGVIRGLGERGLEPIVIMCTPVAKSYVLKSKYIGKSIRVDTYADGIEWMKKQQWGVKPVVICCADIIESEIDLQYDALKEKYYLPGCPKQGRTTELMNKTVMETMAKENGLNIPQSWLVQKDGVVDGRVQYPCIVKPILGMSEKEAVKICHTEQELIPHLKKYAHLGLQVQEYIEKEFEYQLIGCSLDGGNEVIIPGVSKIIRAKNGSNTGFLHYERLDGSYDITSCRRFLMAAEYSGLFSMEFLRGRDRKDYFMEINYRNDGNAVCTTGAGVSLPYVWYLYHTGGDYKKEAEKEIKEIYVMPEFNDFKMMLSRQVSPLKWLRDVMKTDCFMEYSKNDKKPFWHYIKYRLHIT